MTDITTHQASRRRLLIALAITCSFMVIQIIGAYFSNSLAVLADAGHLFVHNSSLFIALIASSMAIHFAKNFNDGYQRAELTGGLINGILYLSIGLVILYEGGERYLHHNEGNHLEINSYLMSVISAIGFYFMVPQLGFFTKGAKRALMYTRCFFTRFLI